VVRHKPDPHVVAWIEAAEEDLLYLSVLTLGEIRRGLAALSQGKRRSRLETWLEVELQARFSGRRWGLLAAAAKIKGKPLSAIDGLLAATAIHHNLTIVSRNVGDFTNTQAPVVNPWEP
jgi:toxin FitB